MTNAGSAGREEDMFDNLYGSSIGTQIAGVGVDLVEDWKFWSKVVHGVLSCSGGRSDVNQSFAITVKSGLAAARM